MPYTGSRQLSGETLALAHHVSRPDHSAEFGSLKSFNLLRDCIHCIH